MDKLKPHARLHGQDKAVSSEHPYVRQRAALIFCEVS